MEFMDVYKGRRSIRKFKQNPVPRALLEEILSESRWCPSWANVQPWEVVVVQGETLEKFRQGQREKVAVQAPHKPDVSTPEKFPQKWHERVVQIGASCLDALSIKREDREARQQYYADMFSLFGAPAMVLFLLDDQLNVPYGMLDIGIYMHGVCLMAKSKGLGTLVLSTVIRYPDVFRELLPIPENKRLVMGIAMGYADESAPINNFERQRVPIEDFTVWAE